MGCLCLWGLSSPVSIMCAEALVSRKQMNICLPVGSSEKIPDFPLLVHAEFVLTSLLTPVFPSYSFPHPATGR